MTRSEGSRPGVGPSGIRDFVDGVRRKVLPTPEDKAWEAFVMERPRDRQAFASLIRDPETAPVFQQRAIEILLAPDFKTLPYKVNAWGNDNFQFALNEVVPILTDEQAQYAAGLVLAHLRAAKAKLEVRQADSSAQRDVRNYSYLVIQLLPRVPKEQADELFEQFHISEPMEKYVELRPLERLLTSGVDESWKRKALEQMHERIKKERSYGVPPGHDTNESRYSRLLTQMLWYSELPVSRELFQEEIEFMLRETRGTPVDPDETVKALSLIEGREIRQAFLRRQVLDGDTGYRFRVYGEDDIKTANALMAEFPEDAKLADYLQKEIKDSELRKIENERQRVERERREERVRQGLRIKRS